MYIQIITSWLMFGFLGNYTVISCMEHFLSGHHRIQNDLAGMTMIENPLQSLSMIVKMQHAIKNGLNGASLPQLENPVHYGADVLMLALEVQQVAEVETTNGFIILVEFKR